MAEPEPTAELEGENGGEGEVKVIPPPLVNGLPEVEKERLGIIERDLDALTYSGSTINDLEIRLIRHKQLYRQTLFDFRDKLEAMKRKLNTSIQKSEPFIEIWRRARLIQEASNKAAAQYDKANSEYMAAKEIVRMAEMELGKMGSKDGQSPSANIDPAWQETLNHATTRVMNTERHRRVSEVEHRRVLEECTKIMEEYRSTERRFRTHIIKSRPYFEERFKCNQILQQMKQHIAGLEKKIAESKRTYTDTLRRLEVLNSRIHHERRASSVTPLGQKSDSKAMWKSASASNTPVFHHRGLGDGSSDTESLESLQIGDGKDFRGSSGSLPSIGTNSVSDYCPTPQNGGSRRSSPPAPIVNGERRGDTPESVDREEQAMSSHNEEGEEETRSSPDVSKRKEEEVEEEVEVEEEEEEEEQSIASSDKELAHVLVAKCLSDAAARLEMETSRTQTGNSSN